MQGAKIQAQASVVKLWETPIFLIKNPEHEIIKQGLIDHICSLEKQQESSIQSELATNIKNNLSESHFQFLQEDDNQYVKHLTNFIGNASMQAIGSVNRRSWVEKYIAKGLKPTLEITESWYHVTRHAGAHGAHSHPNCSWCAVYYVDIGDTKEAEPDETPKPKGGYNVFYRPWLAGFHDAGSHYLDTTYRPDPEDGLLILFPSYLMHAAEPYLGTEKNRIVVALNMRIALDERENA